MNPVIVAGAGAAGLMAAGQARERGRKVILLEKNPRPGCKILASGGGRCNLTNTCDRLEFISAFGRNGRFLHPAFARFFSGDLRELLQRLDVPTQADDEGRVFPSSGKAADVVAALEKWIERLGVEIRAGAALLDVLVGSAQSSQGKMSRWITTARTQSGDIPAAAIVVCTGGITYPQLGATGDAHAIACRLGHTIIPCHPCLAGLHSPDPVCINMQGVSLAARVEAHDVMSHPPRRMARRQGGIIFTHFGVSGPAILDISRDIAPAPYDGRRVEIVIDLLPGESGMPTRLLNDCQSAPRKLIINHIRELLPDKMAAPLLERCAIRPDKPLGQITRRERNLVATTLKALRLTITGSEGAERAMITKGGVSLREIDPGTMQSRLVRGLFFAGEALDIDGPTGGYNLQAAFSTGWLAGNNV